jgi:UPF0755 protein
VRRFFILAPLALIGLALAVAVAGYLYIAGQYAGPGPLTSERTVVFERGAGARAIATRLEENGVIEDASVFLLGLWLAGEQDSLKAGEYAFPVGISAEGVAAKLSKGDMVVRRMTFAEGLTSAEIIAQLEASTSFTGDITLDAPDGTLLPETYHYGYGDPRDSILKRMREGMTKLLDELWGKRAPDLPYETPAEAVVMASIVERETPVAAERPLVARVFLNRLKLGMPLQSDPTVIYAVSKGMGSLDRSLTRDDLKVDSPFNTYRVKGLPPAPIANPGRASIEAALNPGKTDALYFVADGEGGHVFATTLNEHNKNVKQWRKRASN